MSEFTQIKNLDELVKNTINGQITEQVVERLVPPGENYGSIIYKVDFKVKNGNSEKTYHAVAKCTPLNKFTQEIFNTQITFKSEIGWYTDVIPMLQQFQRDRGVKEVANCFQKFYGARISLDPNSDVVDENGVILTENLNSVGYKNIDRHVGFDLKTSKAILRDLAIFHTIPLAIKQQNNGLFEEKIAPFLPKLEFKDSGDVDPIENLKNELKAMPELKPNIEKVLRTIENTNIFDQAYVPKETWGSVCHNDFWTNNIMVTEEEDPKTIILDLQVPRYSSIAEDVIFFLALSVSLDVIKIHMDELLQHYWTQFIKNLSELGSDTAVYSYTDFLDELSSQAKRQLVHALFLGQFVFMEKGRTHFDSSDENFSTENFKKDSFKLNKIHKDRYTWLIAEFVKRNWI